jgi:hypothetical protein
MQELETPIRPVIEPTRAIESAAQRLNMLGNRRGGERQRHPT